MKHLPGPIIPLALLLCAALPLLAGCGGERPGPSAGRDTESVTRPSHDPGASIPPLEVGNRISLEHPVVGAVGRYVRFQGKARNDSLGNFLRHDFSYEPDTLELTVTALTNRGFIVEERFTPGSWNHRDARPNRYEIGIINDSILVRDTSGGNPARGGEVAVSYLFGLVVGIPLRQSDTMIRLSAWGVEGGSYRPGVARDYTQLGRRYPEVNVIVDNSPMLYDGPGHTILLSREHGLIRVLSLSAWTLNIVGWDLL